MLINYENAQDKYVGIIEKNSTKQLNNCYLYGDALQIVFFWQKF